MFLLLIKLKEMVRLLSSLKERKHNKTQELIIKQKRKSKRTKSPNYRVRITGGPAKAEIDVLSCYYKVVNTVNTDGSLYKDEK